MRYSTIVLAAGLAACSGELKPGPVGHAVDMLQYLPDTLRTPSIPPDTTFKQEIVVGPDSARVELTWTRFRRGPGLYLASISARLLQPVRYDSISLGEVSELQNTSTKFRPTESARIAVGWYKKRFLVHRSGVTPFRFDAGGRRIVWPAMGK